jgi:hypothetical protein
VIDIRDRQRNLTPVCQFQHKSIHERGFALRWSPDGRRIETARPDGSPIDLGVARPTVVLH